MPESPRRRALSDRAVANLFLLPTILLLVGMNVFPLFWSLGLSFTKYQANAKPAPQFVGSANYAEMLSKESVWHSFTATAAFVALAVGLQLALGFGLAVLLNRSFRLKGIVTTLFLLPMMLSSVVVGLFWQYLLDANFGLVNYLLGSLHLMDPKNPIDWTDRQHALWAVTIADTWQWTPFVMLISLAGLASVPKTLYEAASVDRASEWFRFRYITLPFVAPLLMIALLFRTLDSFKMFDLAWIMTERGATVETVSIQVYREALRNWNTGKACALAYIVLLVIIGLTNLFLMLMARIRGEATLDARPFFADGPALRSLQSAVPVILGLLGVWGAYSAGGTIFVGVLAAALGFCALLFVLPPLVRQRMAWAGIGIALIIYLFPLFWMVQTSFKARSDINAMPPKWVFTPTLQNYAGIFAPENRDFVEQLGHSLIVAVSSTAIAVVLGTLAAYAFSRFKIKAKNDALFFILSTRMLPPVVVLVPVLLMYQSIEALSGGRIKLLDTLTGLGLLYTTVGAAFATWLMKGFTDDVPPEYEEAALLDRYSRLRAMQKTVLPLVLPGMAVTGVFVFLNSWNEYAFGYFLSGLKPLTAPPSITAVIGGGSVPWNEVAARAIVFLLPAAFFTFLFRNQLLRGMTFGAIKGR